MFAMSDSQFGLVYNILSFSLASMMSTTLFLWMRIPAVKDCYASALIISGEVTFIAAYHYLRIFNSWVEAYEYKPNSSGDQARLLLIPPPPIPSHTLSYFTMSRKGVREHSEGQATERRH